MGLATREGVNMAGNFIPSSGFAHALELHKEMSERYARMSEMRPLWSAGPPRAPTKAERLTAAFAWRIERVKDAWAVLIGDAYAERD